MMAITASISIRVKASLTVGPVIDGWCAGDEHLMAATQMPNDYNRLVLPSQGIVKFFQLPIRTRSKA
jgi:hypothetical protein